MPSRKMCGPKGNSLFLFLSASAHSATRARLADLATAKGTVGQALKRGRAAQRRVESGMRKQGTLPTFSYYSGVANWGRSKGMLSTTLIDYFNLGKIQGRRVIPSNCSRCLSKAKAFFSLRAFMTAKLVQSVKLNLLSAYCLKIVKPPSSLAVETGITST